MMHIIQGSIYANGKIYLNDRSITTGTAVSGDQVIRGANVSVGSISQYAQVERYTIPVKTVTIGTSDISVPIEGTRILEPGSYKDVTVLDRGQITRHLLLTELHQAWLFKVYRMD
jgi:hypothetical protein